MKTYVFDWLGHFGFHHHAINIIIVCLPSPSTTCSSRRRILSYDKTIHDRSGSHSRLTGELSHPFATCSHHDVLVGPECEKDVPVEDKSAVRTPVAESVAPISREGTAGRLVIVFILMDAHTLSPTWKPNETYLVALLTCLGADLVEPGSC